MNILCIHCFLNVSLICLLRVVSYEFFVKFYPFSKLLLFDFDTFHVRGRNSQETWVVVLPRTVGEPLGEFVFSLPVIKISDRPDVGPSPVPPQVSLVDVYRYYELVSARLW